MLLIGFLALASCGGSGETSDTTLSDREAYKEAVENADSTSKTQVEPTEITERPEVTLPETFNKPEDEILATYLAYHEARLVAAGKPEVDPNYPALYEFLVEPQASLAREGLEKIAAAEQVIVDPGGTELGHSVRFVGAFSPEKTEGNSVTILDCFVDATEIQTLDGEVLENDPVTFVLAVEMKVVDGAWKVAARDVKDRYEGVNECEEYANV